MGSNTLVTRADGQTITQDWFNDVNQALAQDFLPRNAANVPTPLAGSLGTNAVPWDKVNCQTAIINGVTLDPSQQSLANNRLVSFKTASNSDGYPDYLTAGGGVLTCTLSAAATNFEAVINGTPATIAVDVLFPVTAGFTINNTATINEPSWTAASSQEQQSLVFGEKSHESVFIAFDGAGSEITTLAEGSLVFFRGVNAALEVEYIYGEVYGISGATFKFRPIWRGIDSTGTRIKFRDNNTWTLCKATYLFTDSNGVAYTSNIHPVAVDTLPSAGTAGLYIFRKSDQVWYLDNGATVTAVNRIFVGVALSHNATENSAVVYLPEWGHVRQEFLNLKKDDSNIQIANDPLNPTKGLLFNGKLSFAGANFDFQNVRISTGTAGDRETGTADISAIGIKYVYVAQSTGKLYFSDNMPRKWGEGILMHPSKMWRCVGFFFHTASTFHRISHKKNIIYFSNPTTGSELVLAGGSIPTSHTNFVVYSGFLPSFLRYMVLQSYTSNFCYESLSYSGTEDSQISSNGLLNLYANATIFSGYLRIRGLGAITGAFYATGYPI